MSTEEIVLLLQRLKNGDMSAFEGFFNRTKKAVFFAAYAILKDQMKSEDILQDVYLKFLDKLDKIEIDRGVVALLATIAHNLALNMLKNDRKNLPLDESLTQGYQEETTSHGLFHLMKKLLDDDEYEIVVLHVIDELKHREIAEMLNVPLGTVTWKYNNALAKLKKGLGE